MEPTTHKHVDLFGFVVAVLVDDALGASVVVLDGPVRSKNSTLPIILTKNEFFIIMTHCSDQRPFLSSL